MNELRHVYAVAFSASAGAAAGASSKSPTRSGISASSPGLN